MADPTPSGTLPEILSQDAIVDKKKLEAGNAFAPRFDAAGLITAVVCDDKSGNVVMVAYMNEEALKLTLGTGIAHYWSRSRQELWKKGETSGNLQTVVEMRTDCDQDVLVLRVDTQADGANCHTGRQSCFYRTVEVDERGQISLAFDAEDQPRFDPDEKYGDH